jgi:uncharacterized protein (UPF0335 family)
MAWPSNSDGILLDLWLRWAEEEGARLDQQETLKNLFAEAKENGLNPKSLRKAFRRQYAALNETQADRDKREASDAETDQYLDALARVRARVREEDPDHDADGVITEPTAPVPSGVAADAPEDVDDAPLSSGATPSTAAGKDRPAPVRMTAGDAPQPEPQDRIGGSGNDPQAVISPAGTQAPPVDTLTEPERIASRFNFNPATHFKSSKGLLRLHGCQEPGIWVLRVSYAIAAAASWRQHDLSPQRRQLSRLACLCFHPSGVVIAVFGVGASVFVCRYRVPKP